MGRTALVVDGAGGIGAACADWFRSHGDEVVVLDRAHGHDATEPAEWHRVVDDNLTSAAVVASQALPRVAAVRRHPARPHHGPGRDRRDRRLALLPRGRVDHRHHDRRRRRHVAGVSA
ncbi:MAG TPA: hypothetical protein VHH15_07535 [Actinophytocola sp.]|nr:hypothetical protein [Actinophytocola sp.]